MCNAWNHPPGCDCGWGGEGHLGRRPVFVNPIRSIVPRHLSRFESSYESYVNPNAKCPVCGENVFFYQSSEGGRVFFDELGPPWPKHPCTDSTAVRGSAAVGSRARSPNVECKYIVLDDGSRRFLPPMSNWYLAGWRPFVINSVASDSPQLLRITGIREGEELVLYLIKTLLPTQSDPRDFVMSSAVHAQRAAAGQFRIAMFTPSLRELNVLGYESSIAASNAADVLNRSRGAVRRFR